MKGKKTYRLQTETIDTIAVLKSHLSEKWGIRLSDGQVVEMAVRSMLEEYQKVGAIPEFDSLDQPKIEALKGEFGNEI